MGHIPLIVSVQVPTKVSAMLSPNQAANKANVSRKTIMNNIKSGKLIAHRNNENNWSIRPSDLANWMGDRVKADKDAPSVPPSVPPTEVSPVMSHPSHGVSLTQEEYKELLVANAELDAVTKLAVLKDAEISELREEVQNLRERLSHKDETIVKLIEKSYEGIQTALKEQREELNAERRAERTELVELLKAAIKPEPLILTREMRIK